MKLFISLLIVANTALATPVKIFWNTSKEQVHELNQVIQLRLGVPKTLITNQFRTRPCGKFKVTAEVLIACLSEGKLKILHKNSEALNNAYRVFRDIL